MVSMVISLGYNRQSAMQNDSEEDRGHKIFLFWLVYIFDTCFSTRLGRSPILRDHDITVPTLFSGGMPEWFAPGFRYWIENGRLQCQAVQELYSSEAVQQPRNVRAERARGIALNLQKAWDLRDKVREELERMREREREKERQLPGISRSQSRISDQSHS